MKIHNNFKRLIPKKLYHLIDVVASYKASAWEYLTDRYESHKFSDSKIPTGDNRLHADVDLDQNFVADKAIQDSMFSLEVDRQAGVALSREMANLCEAGYRISIGKYKDPAYQDTSLISTVYNELSIMDKLLDEKRNLLVGWHTGGLTFDLLSKVDSKLARKLYEQLEPIRDQLLFSPTKGSAWHNQRGRSLALETIWFAHDLRPVGSNDGIYNTMIGELEGNFLSDDFRFGKNSGDLCGKSLQEALLMAETIFNGRSVQDAQVRVNRRITETKNFSIAPVTEEFKMIVAYCVDGIGIRSRGNEVGREILEHIQEMILKIDDHTINLMSYGCGTARTIIDAAVAVKKEGRDPKVILLDQDPVALAAATEIAKKNGISDNEIEVHCKKLFDKHGNPMNLAPVLRGRTLHIAEDSGLREYLPNSVYKKITSETWRHLSKGGLMSTGNMTKNRPHANFLHGMMGWYPQVRMRSIEEGFNLHKKAGVPSSSTRAVLTADGVYALFFSVK